jgi:hypothetical protein
MREAPALALFVTALAAIAVAFRGRPLALGLAVPAVAGLALLRIELAGLVVAGTGLAVAVALLERYRDRRVTIPQLALGVGVVGLVGMVPFSMRFDIATLNYQLDVRATGGAVYLSEFRYGSWLDVLLAAPIRGLYFQFAPFPLHVDAVFDLAAALVVPLVVVLVVAAARSLRDAEWMTPVGALIGLVYVGGILGYGLVDANFGTTVRHRIPFDILLLVVAAPVLQRWWDRLRRRVGVAPGDGDDQRREQAEAHERGGLGGP